MRAPRERCTRTGSVPAEGVDGGDGGVATGELIAGRSWVGSRPRGPPGGGPHGRIGSAGVLRRVLGDLVDVRAVDEGRAGEHRLAAAEVVAVGQVEPQRLDGHVTLDVGLLVDGELDRAVLDVLGD